MKHFLLFLILFAASCSFLAGDSIEKTVKKINSKCPAQLDADTRIDSVSLKPGQVICYHYTLLRVVPSAFDSVRFKVSMWPALVSQLRVNSDMKALREKAMVVEYLYCDLQGHLLSRLRFTPQDYQ